MQEKDEGFCKEYFIVKENPKRGRDKHGEGKSLMRLKFLQPGVAEQLDKESSRGAQLLKAEERDRAPVQRSQEQARLP